MDRMRTANRDLMKEWNEKLVLNLIRKSRTLSQVEVIRKSGLSAGTVVNITRGLRKDGFVSDAGYGKSIGGRRPVNFCFNDKARWVIGSALRARETKIAVLDLAGRIERKISYPTRPERGQGVVFREFGERLESLISETRLDREKIIALCIGINGITDPDGGSLVFSSHLGWRNVPIRKILEQSTRLKVFVESEARATALGEYWFGAAREIDNLICVLVNDGIGAAIIIKDKVYHGSHQMEGEIGHTVVLKNGSFCSCGKNGCLETIASGLAILERTKTEFIKEKDCAVSKESCGWTLNRLAFRRVIHAADEGNRSACRVLQEAGRYLGVTISGAVNYADPGMVVLTGYVAEEDTGVILESIRKVFEESALDDGLRKVEIVKGNLGEDAILIGSATLAYQNMFTLSH